MSLAVVSCWAIWSCEERGSVSRRGSRAVGWAVFAMGPTMGERVPDCG
jgi:hypothetical protein